MKAPALPKEQHQLDIIVFYASTTNKCFVLDIKDIKQIFEDSSNNFGAA